MLFNLNNDVDRVKYKGYCNRLFKEGGVVEVKKKRRPRSLPQNNYLHLCLSYFASEFGYSLVEVKHDVFKKVVNRDIFMREHENKRGQKVMYVRSTSDLDTKEMTNAIEKFRNYSSSVCGLYIPESNEYDALVEVQKQIDGYLQYL